MRQDGAPGPKEEPWSSTEAAHARAQGREGGAVTSRRCSAPGSLPAPGPTPPSSHRANPEVEEEARRRRWPSGQALAEPNPGACLGWGRGAGLSALGSQARTGQRRPWPPQSCRGSTRSWLRSTRRYPSWAGSRGSPALRPRVALAATRRDGGERRRGHASVPLLSAFSVHHYHASTCSSQEMGPGCVWVPVRVCVKEQEFDASFSLN